MVDMQAIEPLMLEKLPEDLLRDKANCIRRDVVRVSITNGAGHLAPSLSCIDILVALYYKVMNLSCDPLWEERDRLVFSKAHGCYGLYAILTDCGYLGRNDWNAFNRGSFLAGCLERNVAHGIEAGCGALGHGLPIAAGIAFGARLQHKNYRVYCVVGDGEMQEGSNWEALQFAVKYELSNLTIIIDCNGLQAMDYLENVLTVKGRKQDLHIKVDAFGSIVEECDGHDPDAIATTIEKWRMQQLTLLAPQVLLAKTTKGCGLLCMENIPKFHFRLPSEEELKMGKRYE